MHNSMVNRVALAAVCLLFILSVKARAEYYFNPQFISPNSSSVASLEKFNRGVNALPGKYWLDIYFNGQKIGQKFVTLNEHPLIGVNSDGNLQSCFSKEQFDDLNINEKKLPHPIDFSNKTCIYLDQYIPQAKEVFSLAQQRLDIDVPQLYLRGHMLDGIPIEQWDDGINAYFVNYDISGQTNWSKRPGQMTTSDFYVNLQNGINIKSWRIRNYSIWQSDHHQSAWKNLTTYVEHPLPTWQSEMRLGDVYSDGKLFDSVSYRGVNVYKDISMLPDSVQNYAPIIRGIAKANSTVYIYQKGNLIYQKFVPMGPFEISDVSLVSSAGDLDVVVDGVDGQKSHFTVHYSSLSSLLREGLFLYNLSIGRIDSQNSEIDRQFIQGTAQWGINHGMTISNGFQLTPDYHAIALSLGKNMGSWGAFSATLTYESNKDLQRASSHSNKLTLDYLVNLPLLDSELSLTGSHYYSEQYRSLSQWANNDNTWSGGNELRNQVSISISKNLPSNLGSLYLSGYWMNYWDDKSPSQKYVSLGYNNNWGPVVYGLNYSNNESNHDAVSRDNILSLTLSLPFSALLPHSQEQYSSQANISLGMMASGNNRKDENLSLSGTVAGHHQVNYYLQQNYHTERGVNSSSSVSAGVSAQSQYANMNMAYMEDDQQRLLNYNASGSVLIHRHGVVFGQSLGETNALIYVKDLPDLTLDNNQSIYTNGQGYALLPGLTDYRYNQIGLDINKMQANDVLKTAMKKVVPTKGAIVWVNFPVISGEQAIFTLVYNGKPVPFGAAVTTADHGQNGIVGDSGKVYLSGLAMQGRLWVSWGHQASEHCQVNYHFIDHRYTKKGIQFDQEICQ